MGIEGMSRCRARWWVSQWVGLWGNIDYPQGAIHDEDVMQVGHVPFIIRSDITQKSDPWSAGLIIHGSGGWGDTII